MFRKAVSVLTSAALIGSTVTMAAAVAYPAPFNAGNSAVVYGADSATADMTAAATIQNNINAALVSDGSADTTVEGGDSYQLERTSTKLHLGDNIATAVRSTLTDDHLPTLLADGKFIDDDNDEFDYTQKIVLGPTLNSSMWEDNDYADDTPTVGYRIPGGQTVLNYTLTFSDQPLFADLPTTSLPIMGKEYYVLSNSSGNSVLTLLDSATDAVLTEGDTTTLSVGKNSYDVSISYISSAAVKLTVNGETTNSLAALETYKLSDGSYVGIKELLYNAKDTGISSVEFSIGKGKLKLTSGSEVQVNDVAVPGLEATITNASGVPSATSALASIRLDWKADTDLFLTEDTEIIMPQFETVKMAYTGATYPVEEVIEIKQGGDTYAVLEDFPLKDGTADIAFLYGDSNGFNGTGKDANNKLITSNLTTVTYDADTDEYFIVSYAATTEGESYLMRANNFVLDGSDNETNIQYYKDGVWTDKKAGGKEGDTFSIGNAELGIGAVDRAGKNVVITANSSSTNFYHLYSAEGLRTYLPFEITTATNVSTEVGALNLNLSAVGPVSTGHNGTMFYLNFSEEDKDGNIGSGAAFTVNVGWDSSTTAEVEVSDLVGNNDSEIEIQDTDVWRTFMYSALATEFLYNKPSSGQDSIKIIYHGDEVELGTYVVSSDAVIGSGESGVAILDDSAAVTGKNVVVVGGSAINAIAAELVGAVRGPAFTEATGVAAGEFLIETFAYNGNVALLVAGYDPADTTKAATYLTNTDDEIMVEEGKKYTGSSATEATLVTTA